MEPAVVDLLAVCMMRLVVVRLLCSQTAAVLGGGAAEAKRKEARVSRGGR